MTSVTGRFNPSRDAVKMRLRCRAGRVRGLRAQRLVDGIGDALMATTDPFEYAALADLRDRAGRLARRASGIRGMF